MMLSAMREIFTCTHQFLRRYPQLAEHIRTVSPNGKDAFWEARHYQPYVRQDWMAGVNVTKVGLPLFSRRLRRAHP